MTTKTPTEVLTAVDSIVCSECYPEVWTVRLPGDVHEITVTHSYECGLPEEHLYV